MAICLTGLTSLLIEQRARSRQVEMPTMPPR
jgi:hypothetical protein